MPPFRLWSWFNSSFRRRLDSAVLFVCIAPGLREREEDIGHGSHSIMAALRQKGMRRVHA